jgi:hypothetical protein
VVEDLHGVFWWCFAGAVVRVGAVRRRPVPKGFAVIRDEEPFDA